MNLCKCRGCIESGVAPFYSETGRSRGRICAAHWLLVGANKRLVADDGHPIIEIGRAPRTWTEQMRAAKRLLKWHTGESFFGSGTAEHKSWVERLQDIKQASIKPLPRDHED
jgi:hypothetical protein